MHSRVGTTSAGVEPGLDALVGPHEGASPPTLKDLLQILRKRLWVVVLAVVVLTGLALGFSLLQTPKYEADTLLLVGQESLAGQEPGASQKSVRVTDLQQLTQTMTVAVNTRPNSEAVIQDLDLQVTPQPLRNELKTEQVKATQLGKTTGTDSDPQYPHQIVNAVGEEFSAQDSDTSGNGNDITDTVCGS